MVSTAKATYLMANLKIQLYHGKNKNKSENRHKLITLLLWF